MNIVVRSSRVSADWTEPTDGMPREPKTTLTYWRVIVEGRIVDSFTTKERAEKRAEQLRQGEPAVIRSDRDLR